MRYLLICLIATVIPACREAADTSDLTKNSRTKAVQARAQAYFDTFSERNDWEKLLSFYREDMIFEDVLLQLHLDSLWQFERFYDWPDTNFRKLTPEQRHLELEQLVVNDSVAVATGHINPFYWQGQLMDLGWGMNFVISLQFDENLKIVRQVDWMEYDPSVLESVIQRYRTAGIEDPPSWLNLEK